jgi:hypothetical protein
MKTAATIRRYSFVLFVGYLLLIGMSSNTAAQDIIGISVAYDFFPYRNLANPAAGTFEEDLEIQLNTLSFQASFPLVFAKGKTLVLNHLNYDRIGFDYRNWDHDEAGDQDPDAAYSVKYTIFLIRTYSQRWQLIAAATPGLASDFEGDLSSDDFVFEAMLGFIRRFGKHLSLGAGLAYIRDFGEPLPLPFVAFEWNISPRLSAKGLVPQSLEVSYRVNPKMTLGLSAGVSGDRYHGDPDKYDVDNPQLKYTVGTVGPTAQIHFSKWIHLNLEGGFTLIRNFEFLDGDDLARSLDLKQTGYLRAKFQLGI